MAHRLSLPARAALAAASIAVLAGCTATSAQKAGPVTTDSPAVAVPASFPTAVPLYSGKVVDARGLGSGSTAIWTVTVALPDEAAIDDIRGSLASSGFSAMKEKSGAGAGSTIVASSATYSVLVVESKNASGWFANYTVTAARKK